MNIYEEIITDRGVAIYLGDFGMFAAFVHITDPPKDKTITNANSFDTKIDILLSSIESKEDFLGSVPFNYIVHCAVEDGFKTEDESVRLSKDDCSSIDELTWRLLSKKYRLVPTTFVMPTLI